MSALPDPRQRDLVKCEDMRLHAERARRFLGSRSLDEFLADDLVQSAVVRCVEVIGEAGSQILICSVSASNLAVLPLRRLSMAMLSAVWT